MRVFELHDAPGRPYVPVHKVFPVDSNDARSTVEGMKIVSCLCFSGMDGFDIKIQVAGR